MLRDEIARYTELSGNDGEHTPIGIIGAYLDGYEKGLESREKKGEWIHLEECSNSGYYCSNCHKKLVKDGWSDTVKKIKFCPNCGADMRGET